MCHDHLQQDGLTLTRDMTGDGPQGGSSELLRAVSISFSAGARAAWRTHPLNQTLFIVGGRDHLRQEKKGKLTSGACLSCHGSAVFPPARSACGVPIPL